MREETVFIIERYAKQRAPVPQELIDKGKIKQIFRDMWDKYLRRCYDWSVDLMVGLKLKEVPLAEYKVGYYAAKLGI